MNGNDHEHASIVRLEERLASFMRGTVEYRDALTKDLGDIKKFVSDLPCKERGEMYKGIGVGFKLLWGAIGIVFTLLVAHLKWQ